jgi:heptosyltransferase-2
VYLLRPYVADVLAGLRLAHETLVLPPAARPVACARWIADLRRRRCELAVLFTNSFRTAAIARLAGARRRAGYARDGRSWLLTDRLHPPRAGRRYRPVSALDYYNALARHLGCDEPGDALRLETLPGDEAAVDARLGPTPAGRPLVLLNPGANYGEAKCWPPEKYAALSDALVDRHDARVVASLGPKERWIAERLRASARRPLEVFIDPPLGLGPLKALVRRCRLLITNDTGPRHFAAAFGVPVVTIFGSSDPGWTDTRYRRERIVRLDLDCQPCMRRRCPLRHHNCMNQLEPSRVLEAVDALLPRAAAETVCP